MAKHRSDYLINQLISNKLSQAELDEFLAGLHNEEDVKAYSDALETYFDELLKGQDSPPELDEKVELPIKETKPDS